MLIILENCRLRFILLLSLLMVLAGCSHPRPDHINNICKIFQQYPQWYWDTQGVQQRWGIPIAVQMAIIYEESSFKANARPPRTKLLWIIPWKRPTSAYGYSQALKVTWENYKKDGGRYWVSRDKFADAADFIGWYAWQANRKLGIAKNDTYRLYLAYHEGLGGYAAHSYLSKPWLINVARKVKYQSLVYQHQLYHCQKQLPHKPWYRWS